MLQINLTNKSYIQNFFIYLVFLGLFILGLFLYKDYGVHADEFYSRFLGLVSLNYVSNTLMPNTTFNFQTLNSLPDLNSFEWRANGVSYEIFLLLIENIFRIDDMKSILYSRRIINFSVFFISNLAFFSFLQVPGPVV